jgi:hypothetical protein
MVSPRKTHVLEKLADAGDLGCADSAFVSRFTPELLDLLEEELATVEREIKIVRGWPVDFARIRITNEGRKLIEKSRNVSRYELMHRVDPAQAIAA